MREIKFRAWGAKNPIESNKEEVDYNPIVPYDWKLNDVFEDRDLIFMQYTGLKDKNGKEIYEGDIVKSKSHGLNYEIKFIEGGFCADKDNIYIPTDINHFYPSTGCDIEIIGNIYENPDLLKNN